MTYASLWLPAGVTCVTPWSAKRSQGSTELPSCGVRPGSCIADICRDTLTLISTKPLLLKTGLVVVALAAIVEVATRASGLTDFPLYDFDDEIGYIVKPDQRGRFLNKNAWFFNSKSMATEQAWSPAVHPNILLIGNSIVMGGNVYDQKDKIQPLISNDLGSQYSVWPIATGGWTNVNEVAYLKRNPDVAGATNFFVWEYMYGGLHELSKWRGEYVFPSQRPVLASWYVFRRYVLPRLVSINMNELPPSGAVDVQKLGDFDQSVSKLVGVARSKHPGIVFLYPDKAQLSLARRSQEWLPERAVIKQVCDRYGLILLDVAQDPAWTESLYNGGTHPTVQGNVVLAHILSSAISKAISLDQKDAVSR